MREAQIVAVGDGQPKVERGLRHGYAEFLPQNGHNAVKFLLIGAAVGFNMGFVVPSGDAGALHGQTHRAAVVGAIEQKRFEQFFITRHKARAQAGRVGAFGQAGEHDDVVKRAPQFGGGLQAADGFVSVKIDFGVAFIGSDDKAIFVL